MVKPSGKGPICKVCVSARVRADKAPCSTCNVNKPWLSRVNFRPSDVQRLGLLEALVETWERYSRTVGLPEDPEAAAAWLSHVTAVDAARTYLYPDGTRKKQPRRDQGALHRVVVDPRLVDLRERRIKLGLGQKAAAFGAGVGRQHLSAVERGLRRSSDRMIRDYTAWIEAEERKAGK